MWSLWAASAPSKELWETVCRFPQLRQDPQASSASRRAECQPGISGGATGRPRSRSSNLDHPTRSVRSIKPCDRWRVTFDDSSGVPGTAARALTQRPAATRRQGFVQRRVATLEHDAVTSGAGRLGRHLVAQPAGDRRVPWRCSLARPQATRERAARPTRRGPSVYANHVLALVSYDEWLGPRPAAMPRPAH